jgi:hypothetical protein
VTTLDPEYLDHHLLLLLEGTVQAATTALLVISNLTRHTLSKRAFFSEANGLGGRCTFLYKLITILLDRSGTREKGVERVHIIPAPACARADHLAPVPYRGEKTSPTPDSRVALLPHKLSCRLLNQKRKSVEIRTKQVVVGFRGDGEGPSRTIGVGGFGAFARCGLWMEGGAVGACGDEGLFYGQLEVYASELMERAGGEAGAIVEILYSRSLTRRGSIFECHAVKVKTGARPGRNIEFSSTVSRRAFNGMYRLKAFFVGSTPLLIRPQYHLCLSTTQTTPLANPAIPSAALQ